MRSLAVSASVNSAVFHVKQSLRLIDHKQRNR